MNQCQADTRRGVRCARRIAKGKRYCGHHGGFDWKRALLTVGGAVVGNLVVPGAGGAIAGALVANMADRAGLALQRKRPIFLSFDFDHDRRMKTLFVGQCRNPKTPFEIVDHSLQEAAPEEEWMEHAAEAIARSELVVVLLGRHTWRAQGVLAEVYMARRLGVPVVQVWAYKDMRGRALADAGRCYVWDWAVLAHVLG